VNSVVLDKVSQRLLSALQLDSRRTLQELAEAVGLSPTPCWRRIKAMEEAGVIRGYTAVVDREKVGLDLCVLAHISIARHVEGAVTLFEEAMMAAREVIECHLTTGDADYIIKVVVADTRAYDRFLQERIFPLSMIGSVRSNIALREVKAQTILPL
jgi:Lrp/AsnC family leucine-responsive transcriptional regulator